MANPNGIPYAEKLNYWKTSRSAPDSWIARTMRLIEEVGGTIESEAFMSQPGSGKSAFALTFEIDGESYKIVWPILRTEYDYGNDLAARRQAATFIYHDVKAKCMVAKVMGNRTAFLQYLVLAGGKTAAQLTAPELKQQIPKQIQ